VKYFRKDIIKVQVVGYIYIHIQEEDCIGSQGPQWTVMLEEEEEEEEEEEGRRRRRRRG